MYSEQKQGTDKQKDSTYVRWSTRRGRQCVLQPSLCTPYWDMQTSAGDTYSAVDDRSNKRSSVGFIKNALSSIVGSSSEKKIVAWGRGAHMLEAGWA